MTASEIFVHPTTAARRRWVTSDLLLFGVPASIFLASSWYEGRTSQTGLALLISAAAIAFLLWYRLLRRPKPLLIVSPAGLDGQRITGKIGRPLAWHEITLATAGEAVVVIDFAPEDLAARQPEKRVSQIRIAADKELSRETLIREMSRYVSVEAG